MIHIRCEKRRLQELTRKHVDAIRGYISGQSSSYQERLYASVSALTVLPAPPFPNFAAACAADDWRWLQRLILADVPTLRKLAVQDAPRLQFEQFVDMYDNYFSRSPKTRLYGDYNAYSLISGLNLHICPYCDEEPAEVFEAGGRQRRNAQLDHFFPKNTYRGLAMCFFNLVPSGTCNQIKLKDDLGANPYESDIETHTRLFPDIIPGMNFSLLTPEECPINFHATGGMIENVRLLGLEERYKKHQGEACQLLKRLQYYNSVKQDELIRDFCGGDRGELRRILDLELPTEQDWGQKPLTKLKHDILITVASIEKHADAEGP